MVSGGSLVAQACSPISLGCRHGRSCAGKGAGWYSSSSFPHSGPRVGEVSERSRHKWHRGTATWPATCARDCDGYAWPVVQSPVDGNSWLGLTDQVLPVGAVYDWCLQPQCGAVVLFSGTVRDHAADDEGVMRDDVQHLTYEAYEEQVVPAFGAIEAELRTRWPHTGRVALLHRIGSARAAWRARSSLRSARRTAPRRSRPRATPSMR